MNYKKAEDFMFSKLLNELPSNLHYHSIHHVRDVLTAAIFIAEKEGLNPEEVDLLKTAVVCHDSGFTKDSVDHEELGCEIARMTLPDFDYNADQIEKICGMIMATKIPQTPKNLSEQIICDADLDYLGRDDYFKISNYLLKEISQNKKISERLWLIIQIGFLEAHHYFTATAINLRNEKKEEYLLLLKKNLEDMK